MDSLSYTVIKLPMAGTMYVGYTAQGIAFLTATESEASFAKLVKDRYDLAIRRDDTGHDLLREVLQRWLDGEPVDPPLDLSRVSEFERRILTLTTRIGRGQVRPYQWLAAAAGRPGASRAVGNAMRRNPIPLLVPCHRVVAASGEIGSYSMGGPAAKRLWLAREGVNLYRMEQLARQNFRFVGSPDKGTYCYPTCESAAPDDQVRFRTAKAAEAKGYKPCPACHHGTAAQ